MFRSKCDRRGSALLLVLITTAVGLGIIMMLMSQSDRMQKIMGLSKRENRLKYKALSGIEVALADLNERARKKDFSTALGTGASTADHEKKGLIITQEWTPTWIKQNLEPRFTKKDSDGIENKVYYFPDEQNWSSSEAYESIFPKFYHIVSEARNSKTGDSYTAESMMYMYTQGATSLAFGMMDPKLPSGLTNFTFSPAYFGGHVHFGIDDASKLNFTFDAVSKNDVNGNPIGTDMVPLPYVFNEAVTMLSQKPETGYPFSKSDHAKMIFEKDYTAKASTSSTGANDDQAIESLQSSIDFQEIYNKAMTDTPSSANQVVDLCNATKRRACIWMKEDGKAYEYTCGANPLEINPTVRYGAPISGQEWTGNTVFRCSSGTVSRDVDGHITDIANAGSIEVKGIYKASYTFVADDIVAGGDMVNWDQRDASPYVLGLVAQRNVVIPTSVPAGSPELWYQANIFDKVTGGATPSGLQCNSNPYTVGCPGVAAGSEMASKVSIFIPENYYTGKTNFLVPSDSPEVAIGRVDRDDTDDTSTQPACHPGCAHPKKYNTYDATTGEQNGSYVEGRAANYWQDAILLTTSFIDGGVQKGFQRRGKENYPWVLDIDAAIVAGGAIKMDGFWNFGDNANPDSQVRITGIDGLGYDGSIAGNTGNSNAFFNTALWTNGPTVPKVASAYCCRADLCQSTGMGVPLTQNCPSGAGDQPDRPKHMVRPSNHSLVFHGSLVTREYSQLKFNWNHIGYQGFQRSFFYHDPRLSSQVPMGFPQASSLVVQRLWTKENKGSSSLIKGLTH